jgi:hypothetical protein
MNSAGRPAVGDKSRRDGAVCDDSSLRHGSSILTPSCMQWLERMFRSNYRTVTGCSRRITFEINYLPIPDFLLRPRWIASSRVDSHRPMGHALHDLARVIFITRVIRESFSHGLLLLRSWIAADESSTEDSTRSPTTRTERLARRMVCSGGVAASRAARQCGGPNSKTLQLVIDSAILRCSSSKSALMDAIEPASNDWAPQNRSRRSSSR